MDFQTHSYHSLPVIRVVSETADASTFVLDVPAELATLFAYNAGQFCTFRAEIDGELVYRCYSMSSAPGVDAELAVTVKRVPGGVMSNWLHDHIGVGDTLDVMRPSGEFQARDLHVPLVALCAGSGVTPVYSLIKTALATTDRNVHVLYANRDAQSIIFGGAIDSLVADHSHRVAVQHHLDTDSGYLDAATIRAFIGAMVEAEFFICGPGPFMELVEQTLLGAGVASTRIALERFTAGGLADANAAAPETAAGTAPGTVPGAAPTETLTLIVRRRKTEIAYQPGDTILDAARRNAVKVPFSCELGNCASCMAFVRTGAATMRANNALSPAEVAEGWVLTCQAVPVGPHVVVEYEDL